MHNCRLVEKQALGIGWFAGGGGDGFGWGLTDGLKVSSKF